MCRLQGVKMHIATSVQPPALLPAADLAGAGLDESELGLPVTSQIWIVSFPFKLNSVYHVYM